MASAQPASAFPCLSLQLACLLLGAWLAFDAHGGGQAVAPPARDEARVPTTATDDWGAPARQPDERRAAAHAGGERRRPRLGIGEFATVDRRYRLPPARRHRFLHPAHADPHGTDSSRRALVARRSDGDGGADPGRRDIRQRRHPGDPAQPGPRRVPRGRAQPQDEHPQGRPGSAWRVVAQGALAAAADAHRDRAERSAGGDPGAPADLRRRGRGHFVAGGGLDRDVRGAEAEDPAHGAGRQPHPRRPRRFVPAAAPGLPRQSPGPGRRRHATRPRRLPGRPAMAGITGAGQLHVHRGRRYQDGAHRAGQGLRPVHQPQPGAAAAVQSLRLPAATAERCDPPARGRHGADRRVAGEGAGAAGGTAVSRRPWGVLLGWCLLAASAVQAESAIDRQQRELALLREGWYRQVPPAPVPLPMRTAGPADSGQDGVGILLRNVDMYLRGNIGFHVPEVKGWLVPNRAGQPVDFDRPQDMHFQVMEGEVLLSPRQLANLFNEHILAYDGTMLKDFRMSSAAGRLEVEGRVRPLGVGPWLPLRLGGGVEVDAASGALVYRPDQLKVIGLPLYGAMSLVGLPMSALVSLDRPGASLVGSAMRLDYRKVFPLLGIDGHVQEAWLDDQGLHLRFSQAPGQPSPVFSPPAAAGPSFLWLQSGDLKIFEILITYAQVLLKTETPDQVLTFNLQDYRKVLATGTTQVNEDGTFFMQVPPYANPL
ncbi:LOW QUALITY PROTEIN: hypothetical protein PA39016_004090019 [Pseudomonas aeruginosa 39016]|nr:LOW QUALITY PROTEIN: hypothetical protein PA39016_004090019 [Pseudomonas aeruginosa 39016]